MNETQPSVEDRIIEATIDSIEKYGISGATNRRIAEAARVNIAAINYYFRSKDVLIQRVMEITLKNAFDLSDVLPMPGATAQERCAAIFSDILEGGVQYPNLSRAHFHSLLVEGQPDARLQAYITRFLEEQAKDLRGRGLALSPAEAKLALMQIFSAVMIATLAPDLVEYSGVSLQTPNERQGYVNRLAQKLLM
jgi:TetR/AcrR family transcriptional regulator, regulator of cefoperazone and chloramphenicol sensitivity